jgi:hypothetical protein
MAKLTYEELMKERNELREQVEKLTADPAQTDVEKLHSTEKELDEARAELTSMKAQLELALAQRESAKEESFQKAKLPAKATPPGGLHLQDFRGTKTPAYRDWLAAQNNTQPTE